MARNTTKTMNRFLNGINNRTSLFNTYYHYAGDEEFKGLLKDVLATYKKHEETVINTTQKLNCEVWPFNSLKQNLNLKAEKRRVKKLKSDFKIAIEAIKSMDTGIINGFEFVYRNKDLDTTFIENAKEVVEDYDCLLSKLKTYIKKYQE